MQGRVVRGHPKTPSRILSYNSRTEDVNQAALRDLNMPNKLRW